MFNFHLVYSNITLNTVVVAPVVSGLTETQAAQMIADTMNNRESSDVVDFCKGNDLRMQNQVTGSVTRAWYGR